MRKFCTWEVSPDTRFMRSPAVRREILAMESFWIFSKSRFRRSTIMRLLALMSRWLLTMDRPRINSWTPSMERITSTKEIRAMLSGAGLLM